MIRHIVMFKLKDHAHGNPKAENIRIIKAQLEALRGVIPGLLRMDVGVDFSATETSADLVLDSDFSSREALDAYIVHPAHQAVAQFVAEARTERRLVDFEVKS
ncbi:MAG TPA: Dabb family protein [Polyangia bacterium]